MELSKWLRDAVRDTVDRERTQNKSGSVAEIFSCLSGGLVQDACQVRACFLKFDFNKSSPPSPPASRRFLLAVGLMAFLMV